MTAPSDEAPDHAGRPLLPTIVLLLVVGTALLALGLWTSRRTTPTRPTGRAAPLVLLAPADSARVAAPLEVTFSTRAPLHLVPEGWQADGLHLHALVDGQATMPAAADIQALGNGRFRWRLPGLTPGFHTLRLLWARPDHTAIPEGASRQLTVEVR